MIRKESVLLFMLAFFLLFAACGGEGQDAPVPSPDVPQLVSSNPADGASAVPSGDLTLVLTYDQNVTCPSSGHSSVTLGNATITSVETSLTTVTIQATGLEKGMSYELIIPEGVVLGPAKVEAPEVTVQFSTEEEESSLITENLAVADASQQAQNVYDFLRNNYGIKLLSATMANVNWNINEAEWVKLQTGKYPAIAAFDYIHFIESPATWIDYSNTKVVEDWWANHGLVAAGWHWRVPVSEGASEYSYEASQTTFKVSNATVDGTWENNVVKADLEKIAGYLKLLQQKSIPVIWRPLHEAAGNSYAYSGGTAWFWWGTDGAVAYKALWKYMFDYFQDQGLNNLIWVWTSVGGDEDFYPGDAYVDLIGRDIYDDGDNTSLAEEFASTQKVYPTKMVCLSECGNVAKISEQWTVGAQWSYFMPWYDYDRTRDPDASDFSSPDHQYANASWWTDAFGQSEVVTRDEMPDLN